MATNKSSLAIIKGVVTSGGGRDTAPVIIHEKNKITAIATMSSGSPNALVDVISGSEVTAARRTAIWRMSVR